jgi:hypothetical protein
VAGGGAMAPGEEVQVHVSLQMDGSLRCQAFVLRPVSSCPPPTIEG